MIVKTPKCPECGEPAVGTCDMVPGTAMFDGDPTEGEVEYCGDTVMDWNNQRPIKAEEMEEPAPLLVTCEKGHRWWSEIQGLDE